MLKKFVDGIKNIYNGVYNTRNPLNTNVITESKIDYVYLNAIYKTGIGSKIVRLKSGACLKDTLQFEEEEQKLFYNKILKRHVKEAVKYMIGFGRGIIVLYEKGEDLSKPRTKSYDPKLTHYKVFSGDMVSVSETSRDFMDDRYYKPIYYTIRGVQFHYSRVVDFTYYNPTEDDRPVYQYGGVSEFELIHDQLVGDSIVARASVTILEKNASLFYKVKDLKNLMQDQQDDLVKRYMTEIENGRSIYGAGLLDAEDDAYTVNQSLTNLNDVDNITLRRLAMVTGIPLAILVGENVQGLNSTGDNELKIYQNMIEALQEDYIFDPLNELFNKLDLEDISFKENQGRTPEDRIKFEAEVIQNATQLYNLGEDYEKYLKEYDIILEEDISSKFFPEEVESKEVEVEETITGE